MSGSWGKGFIYRLLCVALIASAVGVVFDARAQETPEQIFTEFKQIVSGFPRGEQIASWEAFIMKYPDSPYVSEARAIIASLKSGRSPRTSTTSARTSRPRDDFDFGDDSADDGDIDAQDIDLDFVESTADRAASASGDESFFNEGGGAAGSGFDDTGFSNDGFEKPAGVQSDPSDKFFGDVEPSPAGKPNEKAKVERSANREERLGRRSPRRNSTHSWGSHTERSNLRRAYVIEVAPFAAMSPDEPYVRNTILGAHAGVHVGERWFAEAEVAGVIARQTALLLELKEIDAQPEVLMGHRFMFGAGGGYKLYTGPNAFDGGGHDIFARASMGFTYSDVEVCYENTDGIKCATPQVVSGFFPYGTVGVGYRYYFSPNLGLRADVRYRGVLEIVDANVHPRGNFQLNLGASFSF